VPLGMGPPSVAGWTITMMRPPGVGPVLALGVGRYLAVHSFVGSTRVLFAERVRG